MLFGLRVFYDNSNAIVSFICSRNTYMLSFRNANPGDLYVNRRVSKKWGFIRKSEGLTKSGIYT